MEDSTILDENSVGLENKAGQDEDFLSENNPLVLRFQETLYNHLVKHKEKLIFQHRELTKEAQSAQKEREELGVRLYDVQKKVEKCRSDLQTFCKQCAVTESARPAFENKLSSAKDALKRLQEECQTEQKEELAFLSKVDVLNKQIHHLGIVKNSQQSDVTVLRLAAKKSAAECTQLEADKQKQDDYVNRLLQNIQILQEKMTSYDLQIALLNGEAKAIRDHLTQARIEIDTINLEGKHLFDQWSGSLGKMQTRDESLSNLQQTFINHQDMLKTSLLEVSAIDKDIENEEALTKKLSLVLQRFSGGIEAASKQLADCYAKQESFRLDLTNLKCAVQNVQLSLNAQNNIKAWKHAEWTEINKVLQAVILENHQKRNSLSQKILSNNWADKSVQQMLKDLQKIQDEVKQLEDMKVTEQLDLQKILSDKSEKQTHIEKISQEVEFYQKTVLEKEQEIKIEELESKQCTADIAKKQQQINQLKCKLEKMLEQTGYEVGPAEFQLNNLQKEMEEKIIESQNLQNLWLKQQRNLVQLSQEKDAHSSEIRHLERQFNIYSQRKVHFEDEIERANRSFKQLESNIENLHRRITNMNKQILDEHMQEDNLIQKTILTEDDLQLSLAEGENELLSIKARLEHLKENEENLSKRLLDVESELLQWQQKFHLTKQVKLSVQSEYQKGEIRDLQHGLHKMQVQYAGICRQHGQMAQGMEQAVHRWDVLLTKGEVQMMTGDKKKINTALEKQMESIKQRLRHTDKEMQLAEENINLIIQQYDTINREIDAKILANECTIAALSNLNDELTEKNKGKIQNLEVLITKQQQSNYYQGMLESKYQLCASPDILQTELEKQKLRFLKLREIVHQLITDFPGICSELHTVRLKQMAQMSMKDGLES